MYTHPDNVLSPKGLNHGVLEVIHDPGEDGMSVARVLWGEGKDEEERIAVRWNGNSEKPLGNPVSHGNPTWFLLDDYAAGSVEQAARLAAERSPNSLLAKYREMASDSERERDAEEWSEGLIGDGYTPR